MNDFEDFIEFPRRDCDGVANIYFRIKNSGESYSNKIKISNVPPVVAKLFEERFEDLGYKTQIVEESMFEGTLLLEKLS